jgi:hypothetical protein
VRGDEIVVPGDGTNLWTITHASDLAVGLVGLVANYQAVGEDFHITFGEALGTCRRTPEMTRINPRAESPDQPRIRLVPQQATFVRLTMRGESFVVGVVGAPDDVAADHAVLSSCLAWPVPSSASR